VCQARRRAPRFAFSAADVAAARFAEQFDVHALVSDLSTRSSACLRCLFGFAGGVIFLFQ